MNNNISIKNIIDIQMVEKGKIRGPTIYDENMLKKYNLMK
jgi:hypothetical protein